MTFLILLNKDSLLTHIGKLLIVEMRPEKSDVIVNLRGDWNYFRSIEAAKLYKQGYAKKIFISTALIDNSSKRLNKIGIKIPTEQQRLKSVLVQLGVPEKDLLLGEKKAGGGTKGEAIRVKLMMDELGYNEAIIVTNWWHTKRTKRIFDKVFSGKNANLIVISAKKDITNVSNWWKYRYEAINVLEEFPKLLLCYISPSSDLQFSDDP